MTAPTTLRDVRSPADGASYPRRLLRNCHDALILFAAGFHGRQDGYWIAEAGLTATCVDIRAELLEEMRAIYPATWGFENADAFEFAEAADTEGIQWDLVSIDCYSGAFRRVADLVPLWCRLARVAVVFGTAPGIDIDPPPTWFLTERRHRSTFNGGVYWAVMERP